MTLFLIAVPISCIHQFYFIHTSAFLNVFQANAGGEELANRINSLFGVGGGGLMTIGQMSECAVLAIMPLIARRFTRKSLLSIGVLAYGLRMALFAYVESVPLPPLVTLIVAITLHGVCFGCFIFVAFMVVDEQTTPDIRASAQSLFGLVVFGVGILVGSIIAGYVGEWANVDGQTDYTRLFSVPMWGAAACLALMLLFYPGGREAKREA